MKYFLLISLIAALALAQDNTETQLSVLGDTCKKGDDSTCNPEEGKDGNCCMYIRLGESESWLCSVRPTQAQLDAAEEVDTSDIDAEAYCDNAILAKVSFFVVALVALFAF